MTTLDKTGIEAARDEFVHSTTKEQIERWAYKWADDLLSTADALSSLPAQAMGVKALEWRKVGVRWAAEQYEILRVNDGSAHPVRLEGVAAELMWFAGEDEAKTVAQADYEARILSALVAPSQPAAVGERADALWEQLLPLMQVEGCPPGDPYKDKVAALALIEAALVHRDQVKL